MIGGIITSICWICLLHYVIPENQETFHKIFYGFWLSCFIAACSGLYTSMAPITEATFGHLNYSRDYGLLFTESVSTYLQNKLLFSRLSDFFSRILKEELFSHKKNKIKDFFIPCSLQKLKSAHVSCSVISDLQ